LVEEKVGRRMQATLTCDTVRFGVLLFVFQNWQFVNDYLEVRISLNGGGIAHRLELNRVLAFGTTREGLPGQQSDFMGKAMAEMGDTVDAARGHGLTCPKHWGASWAGS